MTPTELHWRITTIRERIQQLGGELHVLADVCSQGFAINALENSLANLFAAEQALIAVPTLEHPDGIFEASIEHVRGKVVPIRG